MIDELTGIEVSMQKNTRQFLIIGETTNHTGKKKQICHLT